MDHPGFLADILAHPDEDAPRLIYADWLEENGQPERAEFIRVQIAYANCSPDLTLDGQEIASDDMRKLGRRAGRLLDAVRPALAASFPDPKPDCHSWGFYRGFVGDESTPTADDYTVAVVRGFPKKVICPWSAWAKHADAILAAAPVTRVVLTTWPEIRPGIREMPGAEFHYYAELLGQGVKIVASKRDIDNWKDSGIVPSLLRAWKPRVSFTLPES